MPFRQRRYKRRLADLQFFKTRRIRLMCKTDEPGIKVIFLQGGHLLGRRKIEEIHRRFWIFLAKCDDHARDVRMK
jgi:hypothetical protein